MEIFLSGSYISGVLSFRVLDLVMSRDEVFLLYVGRWQGLGLTMKDIGDRDGPCEDDQTRM